MNGLTCNSSPRGAEPLGVAAQTAEPAGLTLHTRELFRQGAVVQIRHGGQTYQLRLTRQDKLILTK